MFVKRHPFKTEVIESNIVLNDENIDSYLKKLNSGNFLLIRGLERLAFENFCNSAAVVSPVDKQLYYLDLFIDASLAKYQMATNVGIPIIISFQGNQHEVIAEDKEYSVSDQNWVLGYMAALARRKMAVVHAFCDINLDIVFQKDETKGGIYSLLFAKFLQRLFIKGEPHGQNLLAAANEIKEGSMPDETYNYALHIDGPLIDLFTPIFTNDEKDFNKMLFDALDLHKKY